jgi:putative restriction endonuclease
MTFGVFIHRSDSIYDDSPAERYQFPKQYLGRVRACVQDWILYYEPSKVSETRGYFAVAKVEKVIPDPSDKTMYLALIEPGSYLDFANHVPFGGTDGIVERGLLNEAGRVSGRAQAAVRPISSTDFNKIIDLGLAEVLPATLPRTDTFSTLLDLREDQAPFEHTEERMRVLIGRAVRDRVFRRSVLRAYNSKCAVTGLRLINGGGRAEVEAAHIRPVEQSGPDIISNGIALCGTAHWMFDRGLITVAENMEILISRQINDPNSLRAMINQTSFLQVPARPAERPHPHFLLWHRENCFKA